MDSGVAVPLALDVLPGGGGLGASTMPWGGGVAVVGVGSVSIGTDWVVFRVEAVGDWLAGLPRGLLAGCGTGMGNGALAG